MHFSKEHIQMANRYMKKMLSTSYQENVLKITVRWYLTPVRIAIIKKTKDKSWPECRQK
jgi:hypothetical protein